MNFWIFTLFVRLYNATPLSMGEDGVLIIEDRLLCVVFYKGLLVGPYYLMF